MLSKGNDMTDADKQALQNAKKGTWPHPILLRARLLSDGGYQQQALAILAGKTSNDFEKSIVYFTESISVNSFEKTLKLKG